MSFSLLSLPNVVLTPHIVPTDERIAHHGTLWVEWSPQPDNTTILVLHLNTHASGITPGSRVTLLIYPTGDREYTFEEVVMLDEKGSERCKGSVKVTVSPPDEDASHVVEDIKTFDQLLTQYAELHWSHSIPESKAPASPPPLPGRSPAPQTQSQELQANIRENVDDHKPVQDTSLRGRLVLMDDSNGDLLGELPQNLNIREDSALPSPGRVDNAAPVVLELHPDMYDAVTGVRPLGAEGKELLQLREVIVHALPPEEQDWMLKGATIVR